MMLFQKVLNWKQTYKATPVEGQSLQQKDNTFHWKIVRLLEF